MTYQRKCCCLQKPACSLVGGEEEKWLVLAPPNLKVFIFT